MFRSRFCAVPFGLVIAGAALAQTPPTPPVGMTLQQYLSNARGKLADRDADGDGRISAAEFAAGVARHGEKATDGKDNSPAVSTPGPSPDTRGSHMFQRFDANGDGYLDKAEIDAMLTRRFERMDANHDGIVTAAERDAARQAKRQRSGTDE